ncbi:L-dopachrome tautomerase yellow-f2-like [Lutzomyia longipalpis]|uniref:L-dopachrome tautomerase yellow-f2-like n=1 Tax=Lutzomyia longipalpis TaxID=7200 RepID=UPI002483861F|nr:L-dopachrome tautomerase yellow-f2-like [Lutzomyia longipalpis]
MKIIFGAAVLCLVFSGIISEQSRGYYESYVKEVYYWKKVFFENLPKSDDSSVGPYRYYIPENVAVNGFGYHPASGLFVVTFPRLRPGVPITLGAFCVDEYKMGSSPTIWGFPNYQMNTLQDSDFAGGSDEEKAAQNAWHNPNKFNYNTGNYYGNYGSNYYSHQLPSYAKTYVHVQGWGQEDQRIIALFHMQIDEICNRGFLVDNGQLVYYQNATYTIQKPALWVIDLPANGCKTRNFPIIRRREFPDRIVAKSPNGYVHITLDYQSEDSCDDLFLYITNCFFFFLVVYDYKKDAFWTFEHETFLPVIAESHFVYDKTFDYDWALGLHSLALGYPDKFGDRTAYYSSIAGTAQYAVSTKILKNRRKSPNNFNPKDFRIMGYRGCDNEPMKSVIDYTYGVMVTTEAQTHEIRCWNINKPLNPDNLGVIFKSDKYNFGTQTFIDSRGYQWFAGDPVPILYASDRPLDLSVVNTRIFRLKVSDAIRGTVCEN